MTDTVETRKCRYCNIAQPLELFPAHKRRKNAAVCRLCFRNRHFMRRTKTERFAKEEIDPWELVERVRRCLEVVEQKRAKTVCAVCQQQPIVWIRKATGEVYPINQKCDEGVLTPGFVPRLLSTLYPVCAECSAERPRPEDVVLVDCPANKLAKIWKHRAFTAKDKDDRFFAWARYTMHVKKARWWSEKVEDPAALAAEKASGEIWPDHLRLITRWDLKQRTQQIKKANKEEREASDAGTETEGAKPPSR